MIKGIDVGHAAAHVEEDDAACLRRETLGAMDEGGLGVLMHEASECGHAEAGGGVGEECAAGDVRSSQFSVLSSQFRSHKYLVGC